MNRDLNESEEPALKVHRGSRKVQRQEDVCCIPGLDGRPICTVSGSVRRRT